MQINDDFTRPALVRTAEARWTPSPVPGVQRLMLDRLGDEVARATSIVRYAPGRRFDRHVHEKGEEFLVLDGVFSDASGDFGPGLYVRNPPGSAHAPWSDKGCSIFVKLRQFHPDDCARVVIDTASGPGWEVAAPGIERLPLHRFGSEHVRMFRFANGAALELSTERGLEILVLQGRLDASGVILRRRDWLRLPPGGTVAVRADGPRGTRAYVKSGHLPPDSR